MNTQTTKPSALEGFKLYYEELPGWKLLAQPLINLAHKGRKTRKATK